jgi:hypothetical protein
MHGKTTIKILHILWNPYFNYHNHKFPKDYYFLSQIFPVVVANNNGAISQKKKEKTGKNVRIVSYKENL